MKVAVVGHLEYVEFVEVDHVPVPGEIIQGIPRFAVAAGGGAVAAAALARWNPGNALFFTSFGDDDIGRRSHAELASRGITLHAVMRPNTSQRRAITFVDAQHERTIVVVGTRHVAHGADPIAWSELATCDAVYITGGDADAVRAARAARVVVATSRILPLLRDAGIVIDALVGSANDPNEAYVHGDLDPAPRMVVRTAGSKGVTFFVDGVAYHHAVSPVVVTGDTYGAGDTFAAGLTYALGAGQTPADAVAFASARAAEVLAFRGPYP